MGDSIMDVFDSNGKKVYKQSRGNCSCLHGVTAVDKDDNIYISQTMIAPHFSNSARKESS